MEAARIIKCDVYKKRINRATTITLLFNESALHFGETAKENYTKERGESSMVSLKAAGAELVRVSTAGSRERVVRAEVGSKNKIDGRRRRSNRKICS